jgi:hypothetical protein
VRFQQQRYADAEQFARDILDSSMRRVGERHPDTLLDMHNLATIADRLEKYSDAEPLYLRTIAVKTEVLGAAHPSTIRSKLRLAGMYERQRRYADAEAQLLSAWNLLSSAQSGGAGAATNPATTGTQAVVAQLVRLYDAWGQSAKARQWRAKLPNS